MAIKNVSGYPDHGIDSRAGYDPRKGKEALNVLNIRNINSNTVSKCVPVSG